MLKTLLAEVKEFKKDSVLTPLFMLLEVAMEMVIPLLMASIIDEGVNAGDMNHIYKVGFYMIIAAAVGLFAGVMGGKYGASASTGFARNLRRAMFARIQTYSFENIDKFSTAGLVTRLTTDVTNLQNAYQMILRMGTRAPASMIVAMFMSFYISPRLASIYLVAVILLGAVLFGIAIGVRKIFDVVFQKYDDLKSSASAFLLIGGLLLAVSVLCWTGILHIPMARVSRLLFQGVLTCMGCFAIGVYIRTSRSAKELLPQIRQEKDQTDAILEWFQGTYDRQAIDSRIEDAGQLSDEELALKRFQIIQDFLVTGRDLPDPSYVDALSEELYGRLFES